MKFVIAPDVDVEEQLAFIRPTSGLGKVGRAKWRSRFIVSGVGLLAGSKQQQQRKGIHLNNLLGVMLMY